MTTRQTVLVWSGRAAVVVGLAAVWFVSPASTVQDTARITSFDTSMVLSRDGELTSDETIEVEMPFGKRGIFRVFDTEAPRRSNVEHPIEILAIERDGAAEPYTEVDGSAGTTTIRIGDENRYLDPGPYTYRIESSTTDVLEPGDEGETLWWWDVVGTGWSMPMETASVSVQLPAEPLRVECVIGTGEREQTCAPLVEGTELELIATYLEPGTPVTLRVAFDADDVAAPIEGSGLPGWLLTLLAAAAGAAAGLGLWAASREREPGFPVLFEPPQVPPAVGARVLEELHAPAALQATLYDLAERGVLVLRGDEQPEVWHLVLAATPPAAELHPLESGLLEALGLREVGDEFKLNRSERAGSALATARATLRAQVDVAARSYLRRSIPGILARVLCAASLVAVAVMVVWYFLPGGFVWWWLLVMLAAFALVTMGMLGSRAVNTRRSVEGRELWSRTGGFARFLTTDSSESRFDAAAHLDWYPRYLGWAVALGVGDEWAKRFEDQGVRLPELSWVEWSSSDTVPAFDMSTLNRSFGASIAAASAAYVAASSADSSSGGFGGGDGFSGGSGGGGGGGGSW